MFDLVKLIPEDAWKHDSTKLHLVIDELLSEDKNKTKQLLILDTI